MPGIISDLTVAGALFLRASARKLLSKNEPEPDLDKYSAAMQNLLNRAPEGLIKDYKWLDIPISQSPTPPACKQTGFLALAAISSKTITSEIPPILTGSVCTV